MRLLDLFAGLEGWSRPWREAGHEVFSVDIDPAFDVSLHADIMDLQPSDLPWKPDVILSSPPCETFSVASIGTHWGGGKRAYEPKTEAAEVGMALVDRTVKLVVELQPRVAVIENPRGVLRNLGIIPVAPVTVWQCHYGRGIAKPTDLWGMPFPGSWKPEPECHNNRNHPVTCCCSDHEAARRGAKTGTQGLKDYATRSEIPAELSTSVMRACEESL